MSLKGAMLMVKTKMNEASTAPFKDKDIRSELFMHEFMPLFTTLCNVNINA